MRRYDFDPDRAVFTVSTRPGLAGLGIRVVGTTGHIEATIDERGAVVFDDGVRGEFTVTVRNIDTANQLVTAAALQVFGTDHAVVVSGSVDRAEPIPGDRADRATLKMTLRTTEREIPATGTTRLVLRPNGDLEAMGDTMTDPRAFGIPLPPLVNLMIHTRWRVTLLPT